MAVSDFIKKLARDFLIIFGAIMIIITILRQIYIPDLAFDLKSIYIIMIFAFVGALTGFIVDVPQEISEKSMRVRFTVHFCILEAILITLASIMGIVDHWGSVIILALEIGVIYAIVRLLSWQNDKQTARTINEKLESFRKNASE